ncbi:MAG: ferredoxin [Chitinispirillaceae bacterium]|jgi:ferredoxin
MNVIIDNKKCIGCGLCAGICPEVFAMTRDGKACVVAETVPDGAEDFCAQTVELCPMEAIMVLNRVNA